MIIRILIIGSCHLTRAFKTNWVELLTVPMIQDIAVMVKSVSEKSVFWL